MAYSVQKSQVAKVVSLSLIMLLAACSSDSRYKRQVNGNEAYLSATPLADLHAPSGMILPVENGDYNIPSTATMQIVLDHTFFLQLKIGRAHV